MWLQIVPSSIQGDNKVNVTDDSRFTGGIFVCFKAQSEPKSPTATTAYYLVLKAENRIFLRLWPQKLARQDGRVPPWVNSPL